MGKFTKAARNVPRQARRSSGRRCCVVAILFIGKVGIAVGSLAPVLRDVFLT